ncbi:MAG TPA: cell division protein FtsH, partial [Opitutaceae bacterium]|nr:cell division protein FtsH [Opitutaceae bacterium]
MPDNDTKKARRQLKNLPPDRFQPKVLIFWIILAFAVIALLYWSPGIAVSPKQMTIYEVITRAEAGDIKTGLIQPDQSGGRDWVLITGELGEPVLSSDRNVKTTAFRAAGRLTDQNMERLQKTNKFIERPTTTLAYQIAAQVIPILIIMGVLYFLFVRQLRQAGRGALNFGKS